MAERNEGLWPEIQARTQGRIGANLRTMYGELLQQPLSPALLNIARQVERQLNAS
jgi:hypothetical protein